LANFQRHRRASRGIEETAPLQTVLDERCMFHISNQMATQSSRVLRVFVSLLPALLPVSGPTLP